MRDDERTDVRRYRRTDRCSDRDRRADAGPDAQRLTDGPTHGAFDPAKLAIRLEPVATGLDSPVDVVDAGDGTGRLFVVEQAGRIRIVEDGAVVDPPFLDIRERSCRGGEQGLLGLAFHPDYPDGPRFFVDYTDVERRHRRRLVHRRPPTPDQADPASERRSCSHRPAVRRTTTAAMLAFGPDGYLYIAMGDGGSGGDPQGNGQNLDTLLGKILRLDVDGTDASPTRSRPTIRSSAGAGARPRSGVRLRNPWRFSFDRATGDLWIGDVGQGPGRRSTSSGRPIRRASRRRTSAGTSWRAPTATSTTRATGPAWSCRSPSTTTAGDCAIIGGYVDRGTGRSRSSTAAYLFAD